MTLLLLLAGNETTTNLIGNAVLALLDHPDVATRLRGEPERVPAFVEEALRFESPVRTVFRVAKEDVELEGGKIRAGQTVFLLLGSANRDERKFPDPDRFDLERDPRDHVAFGFGTHLCLGAPLARLEGRSAVEGLLFDVPPFERAGGATRWVESLIVRGPQSLPLRFASEAGGRV